MLKKYFITSLCLCSLNSFSFDLQDYYDVYTATKGAYSAAYSSYYVAQNNLLTFIESYHTQVPMGINTFANAGKAVKSCPYATTCQNYRSASNVLPKVSNLTGDAKLGQYVDPATLANLNTEVIAYYNKLDDSLKQKHLWLYKAQNSIVSSYDGSEQVGIAIDGEDINDYLSQYRSYRDTWLMRYNNLMLSTPPYQAAKAAYATALQNYMNNFNCANWNKTTKTVDKMAEDGDI